MEVSGKKALKDENIEHCSFCKDYDITTYADGFCLECEVYICDACFVKHKGRRVNRNHSLVNVEDSNSVRTHVDDTYDTCQHHNGELVKFYCSKHDQVCCGDCTVSNHYGCKMEFISNKAVIFENSQDCKNLREGLNKCKTQAEYSVSLIATNRQQLSDFYAKFVRDVETFAEEVIERINSMKKNIQNQGKDLMLNDKRKMDDIQKETEDLIAELSHLISLLDSKKDQPNKLFVTSLLVKPELKRAQHNISIIREKNTVNL
ncbi:E3 ubiquitin-protein ligase TRIM33-like [Ruditapes philippinarum]|uniref:E3 ubiquitin-protein ligase TRIM33-like n=1 Tax=Ruditapes philippinarum TaxID=129788 RepID=UPI00295AB3FE|nr:E3 ubiquitin-protein ligase TRIM33-like [Ruditapes philippinarum]